MLEIGLSVIVTAITLIILYFKKGYSHWKKLGIPYMEPTFPYGNVRQLLSKKFHYGNVFKDLYNKMKDCGDYCGVYFFRRPVLLVLTPEFAQKILIKDFNHFTDHGVYFNEKDDPLSANLFFAEGQQWKKLRSKISPTFSPGKLKQMFFTVLDVCIQLENYLEPLATREIDVEVKELMARFTTDMICSCGFGIECNTLEQPHSNFRKYGKKILKFSKLKILKLLFAMLFRKEAHFLHLKMNDEDVTNFIMNLIRETIDYRLKNSVKRNDFLQLLIDNMADEYDKNNDQKLSFNEIAAQAFIFYFAGFETSGTTLTYVLYLLAVNPTIQEKARQSINETLEKFNGEWNYEAVMKMEYIGQIVEETLRLYPPVSSIHRVSIKDYQLDNGKVLKAGTAILIPNLAFHLDEKYFPDPLKFNPDRFLPEQRSARHSLSFLPFGEGPRICLGMRLGLLQTRMGIAKILQKYKFEICSKTKIPIEVDTCNLVYAAKGEIWLNISKV